MWERVLPETWERILARMEGEKQALLHGVLAEAPG